MNWIKAKDRLPKDNQRILFSPEKYIVFIATYVESYNDGVSYGNHYFVKDDRTYLNWYNHPVADFQWAEIMEPLRK